MIAIVASPLSVLPRGLLPDGRADVARRSHGRYRRFLSAGLALGCALPTIAHAQRAIDVQVGSWAVSGSNPTLYAAGWGSRFWGPLGYNLRGLALVDPDSSAETLYGIGPELSVSRGTGRLVPYGVAGVALVLRPSAATGLAALWNAGFGVEFNPWAPLGLALELSRLVEDHDFRGFWNLDENDRRGWVVSTRLSVRWGGPPRRVRPVVGEPSPIEIDRRGPAAYEPDLPELATGPWMATRIVETALDAMGEPYRWGGTGTEEGFDCSGLVWYAYTTHGFSIPRVSRDQARVGRAIAADVASLEPGDVLLFSNRRGVVTHVGLYVGDAEFIHATTSGGVRIGTLDRQRADASDGWYLDRWIGARRLLD